MKGVVYWMSPKRGRYAVEREDGIWIWFEVISGIPPSIGQEVNGQLQGTGGKEIYIEPESRPIQISMEGEGDREAAHRFVSGEA